MYLSNRRNFLKVIGSGLTATALPRMDNAARTQESNRQTKMPSESFIDFLEGYGTEHPPALRYQEGQNFRAWQRDFREKLESLRGPLPKRAKLNVEVIETVELAHHTRQLLRFPVTEYSNLIAYLLVPKDTRTDQKRPGIIALHGHHQYGIETICGVRPTDYPPYALQAVQSGFVVLAPAWWGWPGRDGHVNRTKKRDKCNVIQMAASMYGINVLNLHIQDGQAAIDVLGSRPEVDPQRIGCMGNSYGGRTAMWLTLFDKRIQACVPSGCMNTFRERSLKLSSCAIQYLPGLLQYGDVPELFSLIAPRPMQLQAGSGDPLITPADRDHISAVVKNAYHKLDAAANFDYVLHPQGHTLQWKYAKNFLARHLKL